MTIESILKEAVGVREREIIGYQVNIENFVRMLEKLPTEWTPEALPHRGKSIEQLAVDVECGSLRRLVDDLHYRDELERRLRCEQLHQRRVMLVREVMIDQLEGR